MSTSSDTRSTTPVVIVSGFLGAGKTTFVSALLDHFADKGLRVAVLENEVGALGVDDKLLEQADEILTATNGCFCHTVHEQMVDFLLRLAQKKFDLIVVEMTGRADPEPVRQAIVHDHRLSAHYFLNGVFTVVDAKYLSTHLNEYECRAQIACADHVAISKIDLRSVEEVDAIERRVMEVNPLLSRIWRMSGGRVKFHDGTDDTSIFDVMTRASGESMSLVRNEQDHDHHHDDHHHDDAVKTISIQVAGLLDKAKFNSWVQRRRLQGANLFRAKGFVAIAGMGTVLVHGVHYDWNVSPWSAEQSRSELVLIGRDLDASDLTKTLENCRVNADTAASSATEASTSIADQPMVTGEIVTIPPYEPPEFFSPPDDCPICPARASMQKMFEEYGAALERYESALDSLDFAGKELRASFLAARRELRQHSRLFSTMVSAYYQSFVLNQAIYYLIEAHGRLSADNQSAVLSLAAYDGYKQNAVQAVSAMKLHMQVQLKPTSHELRLSSASYAACEFRQVVAMHDRLATAIETCWKAMETYTEQRNRTVLGIV